MPNSNKFKLEEITEAIEFKPTDDEFKEPLEYINKIRPLAEKYGICKIIPPKHWKPPFSIDMYNFKFRPRVQRLNELEGKKFRVPIVEGKQLDLLKLYKTVESLGGYELVTKNKRWAFLSKQLNYKDAYTCTTLKTHFENLLYPFLLFEAGITLPVSASRKRINDLDSSNNDIENQNQNPNKRQKTSKSNKSKLDNDKIEQIKCLVCHRGDDEAFMLLCDGCDDSYHTFCLYPPLKEIPKGEWRCPVCVAEICKKPTDTYGFEQSKNEYNLIDFGKMASKFKSDYFKKSVQSISPEEVETEFWRILSSSDESVEVEYGADLHTIETGSGFPTRSNKGKFKENDQPYVDSPWNLNNLSLQEKSVLSLMNVEISGMKIPWAYVGMCFSCFCWHVEDHWSYSINYLHMGDIKTWYGVSGYDAEKFESVMKQNASELFDKSPDLLHHLVTIMDPVFLKENGVPIYRINQKAGEFVVTFPRAYHAGFNQGFNFAEAVNFCPADWMPLGRAAIENYKLVKRHSVFSHDELVCKVALNKNCLDVNTSLAIQSELKIIIDTERENRKILLEKGVKNARKLAFEMLSDDERTCDYCKTTCFVSALNCSCKPEKLVCLNHYEHICDSIKSKTNLNQSQSHRLTVLYRYEIQELFTMYTKLKSQTDNYFKWCCQVEKLLELKHIKQTIKKQENDQNEDYIYDDDDIEIIEEISDDLNSKKPHLNHLCKLLQEAKDNKYPIKMTSLNNNKLSINLYNELEKEINFALNCVKMCKKYLNLFKNDKNLDNNDQEIVSTNDDEIIFVKKAQTIRNRPHLNNLKSLANDLNKLKCEIDQSNLFMRLVNEAIEYENKIDLMIKKWDLEKTDEIKNVLDYLQRIDIEYPLLLVEQLRLMYKQSIWLNKVNKSAHEPSKFTIKYIQELIDEFTNENLLGSYVNDLKCNELIQKSFIDLQELLSIALSWNEKAKKLIESNESKSKLEDLEAVLKEAKFIPVQMDYVNKLDVLVADSNKWIQQAEQLLKDPTYPDLNDFKEIYKKSQEMPVSLTLAPVIETRVNLANEWLNKLEGYFIRSSDYNLLDLLTPRLDLNTLVNKLQNSVNHASNLSPNSNEKTSIKRNRTKSLNNLSMSRHETIDLVINYESAQDLYNKESNFVNLNEKYKLLQIKELENIKECRRLNTEKIILLKNYIDNLFKSSIECIEKNEFSIQTNNGLLNKFKCTSCSNSILNRIHSNQFQQCKLCLGLCCLTCKSSSYLKKESTTKLKTLDSETTNSFNFMLCSHCERSKRPKLDLIINCLVSFESFEIKCKESSALQLCINRVLNWIDRYEKLMSDSDVKNLFEIIDKNQTEFENSEELNNYFCNNLNALKKVELQDIYIDGLLLEVETERLVRLNDLFYLIKKNNKLDEFEQLKTLSEKLNQLKANNNLQFIDLNQSINSNNLSNSNSTSSLPITTINRIKNSKIDKSLKIEKKIKNEHEPKQKSAQKNEKNLSSNKKLNQTNKQKDEQTINVTKNKSRKRDLNEIEESAEEEYCAALKCVKPLGENIKWVQCDGDCNKWFHMICVGITKIKRKEKYLCHLCNETNNETNNSNLTCNTTNQLDESSNSSTNSTINKRNNLSHTLTSLKSQSSEDLKQLSKTTRIEIETMVTEINESKKLDESTQLDLSNSVEEKVE